jgi:hypothetical protein
MPTRIQLSRKKGWRKPAGAVVVSRPTRYGNPYDWRIHGQQEAVNLYRQWVTGPHAQPIRCGTVSYRPPAPATLAAITGRDLACWCPLDQPCHADVLLELANDEAAPTQARAPG